MLARWPKIAGTFGHQGCENDQLFQADYHHVGGETCDEYDTKRLVSRRPWENGQAVEIHYGNIASGDEVMEDIKTRNRIAAAEGGCCARLRRY